jgi:hypothetical protein
MIPKREQLIFPFKVLFLSDSPASVCDVFDHTGNNAQTRHGIVSILIKKKYNSSLALVISDMTTTDGETLERICYYSDIKRACIEYQYVIGNS